MEPTLPAAGLELDVEEFLEVAGPLQSRAEVQQALGAGSEVEHLLRLQGTFGDHGGDEGALLDVLGRVKRAVGLGPAAVVTAAVAQCLRLHPGLRSAKPLTAFLSGLASALLPQLALSRDLFLLLAAGAARAAEPLMAEVAAKLPAHFRDSQLLDDGLRHATDAQARISALRAACAKGLDIKPLIVITTGCMPEGPAKAFLGSLSGSAVDFCAAAGELPLQALVAVFEANAGAVMGLQRGLGAFTKSPLGGGYAGRAIAQLCAAQSLLQEAVAASKVLGHTIKPTTAGLLNMLAHFSREALPGYEGERKPSSFLLALLGQAVCEQQGRELAGVKDAVQQLGRDAVTAQAQSIQMDQMLRTEQRRQGAEMLRLEAKTERELRRLQHKLEQEGAENQKLRTVVKETQESLGKVAANVDFLCKHKRKLEYYEEEGFAQPLSPSNRLAKRPATTGAKRAAAPAEQGQQGLRRVACIAELYPEHAASPSSGLAQQLQRQLTVGPAPPAGGGMAAALPPQGPRTAASVMATVLPPGIFSFLA